jgi:hypothetical protein
MKKLLVYLVPFLLPFVIYGVYVLLARAGIVKGQPSKPYIWLLIAGLVLSIVTVGVLALTSGAEPGAQYTPPRFENGELKSGTFRESE